MRHNHEFTMEAMPEQRRRLVLTVILDLQGLSVVLSRMSRYINNNIEKNNFYVIYYFD
jgi:hypothetical protein